MDDEPTHLEGDVPQEIMEVARDKFPASAEAGKRNLFRALIDDWYRMHREEQQRIYGDKKRDPTDS